MHEQLVQKFYQKAFQYSKEDQEKILAAALYADQLHGDQKRKSGEPYIRWDLRETLSEEVLKEPVLALHDADADALGIIRRIVAQAPAHLENPGFLAIECDYRQSMPLVQIMHKNGFHDISVRKDLAGLDRVVCGCWEGECTNN